MEEVVRSTPFIHFATRNITRNFAEFSNVQNFYKSQEGMPKVNGTYSQRKKDINPYNTRPMESTPLREFDHGQKTYYAANC